MKPDITIDELEHDMNEILAPYVREGYWPEIDPNSTIISHRRAPLSENFLKIFSRENQPAIYERMRGKFAVIVDERRVRIFHTLAEFDEELRDIKLSKTITPSIPITDFTPEEIDEFFGKNEKD